MLSNSRLNLLRTKNKFKIVCFGVQDEAVNIFSLYLYSTHHRLFKRVLGNLALAVCSDIQCINKENQHAMGAPIDGVPQKGCVQTVPATAGSSLPLPLAL